ncbi:MAG TPA: hypothetical protein VGO11_19220 [Chthoniobacteraceae bacterium]|jgi:hypothetical protein|nr:hypothetical protein [Chthoniobacteraceae bacterium]
MKLSLRLLLPCLLAGSGLLLLSGCGEYGDGDRGGGREYHRHAYGGSYRERPYDDDAGPYYGRRYETVDRGDRYDRYDRHDRHYEDRSRTVVVAPEVAHSGTSRTHTYATVNSGNPYPPRTHSGNGGGYGHAGNTTTVAVSTHPGSREPYRPAPHTGTRPSTNVVVNVAPQDKPKGKDKKKYPDPAHP